MILVAAFFHIVMRKIHNRHHARFHGTHYEIGFRWGALLSKHGNFILNRDTVWSVIYDLTDRRICRAEGNPLRRKFREDTRFHILK